MGNFNINIDKLIDSNNIERNEKILILPHNTLRIVDTFVQVELEKMKDPNWCESVEEVIYRVVTRSIKDLGKMNNMDSELVKELIDMDWARYYEIAPRTYIYELIDLLHQQSFVTDIVALFHKKEAWDNAVKCDYYDGTIEGLENYIENNGITAIFMDDISLLKSLIDRKNINMDWKTIFISKMGYNYYIDKKTGALLMKDIMTICESAAVEVGAINLVNFRKEFLKNRKTLKEEV